MVAMGGTMAFTDSKGNPEHVLDANGGNVEMNNSIQQDAIELELEGQDFESQRILLQSVYGAYVRNRDTGEATYACMNGKFFTDKEVKAALDKIHARAPQYDPTASFRWHPILFPYTENKIVNFADYILSHEALSFPLSFWGHEQFDKQLAWIMVQEGVGET